ncbi:MAG TPA: preprotein translocase subunit SecE [Candidatus Paceibacterota bacterium]|nr:preprotein translocase subunit SecE [Candidatus Paceibacterota bacterium]HRZ99166.1 preprotein translocase subunit SecE [Candidatus Paceibacterota bacterium]
MKELLPLVIWVVILGAVFAFLWWQGYLMRFSNYVQATKEELRKCTWPSVDELKGSTMVVVVAIVLLGFFTVVVDLAITLVVRQITG